MEQELRHFLAQELRVDGGQDGAPARLIGHAAVFNSLSENLGGFRERIAPGAFAKALERDDIRALWNHDENYVLGRNRSGTLRLREDETGLAIEIDAPGTRTVRDLVLEPIRRKDVSHMSFRFSVMPDGQSWEEDEDGQIIRTLKEVRLYEVSPVVFPAYPATDIAQRSLKTFMETRKPPVPMNLLRAREMLARSL